jgi:hypothetical protein
VLAGSLKQASEVCERTKLTVDSRVPAILRSDSIRAAGILRLGFETVVPALSVGASDRVYGREVEDIKSHILKLGKACDNIVERPVPTFD